MTAPAHPVRQDRLANALLVLVAAVTAGTLILAAVALPIILDTGRGVDATLRSDEIAACRSSYRAEIDAADAALDEARGHQDSTTFAGLIAAVMDDDAALRLLVDQAPEIEQAIARAQRAKVAADRDYERANALARTDVEAFLSDCHERFG